MLRPTTGQPPRSPMYAVSILPAPWRSLDHVVRERYGSIIGSLYTRHDSATESVRCLLLDLFMYHPGRAVHDESSTSTQQT